mmetsp:Transcript_22311/g.44531  ORF Transcript_22311/g.44531 Transcript_22311/m.44531 type:complete len:261 (+) Transcript_22311:2588-3370(+)
MAYGIGCVDIVEVLFAGEVLSQYRRMAEGLDGGVHVACVPEVAQADLPDGDLPVHGHGHRGRGRGGHMSERVRLALPLLALSCAQPAGSRLLPAVDDDLLRPLVVRRGDLLRLVERCVARYRRQAPLPRPRAVLLHDLQEQASAGHDDGVAKGHVQRQDGVSGDGGGLGRRLAGGEGGHRVGVLNVVGLGLLRGLQIGRRPHPRPRSDRLGGRLRRRLRRGQGRGQHPQPAAVGVGLHLLANLLYEVGYLLSPADEHLPL